MLILKMFKYMYIYIYIYTYKLSLFGRDDTKQAKSLILIFHCCPSSRTISKSTHKKPKKTEMLDVIRTYNNSN